MIEEFILRAMIGGTAISLASGPVGCLILWRKLAYFGDTLAHSALLGVALAVLLDINTTFAVFTLAVIISLILTGLRQMELFSPDALLGVLSHTGLAAGLVLLALISADVQNAGISLNSVLFGDVLALDWNNVWTSVGFSVLILIALASQWKTLIAHTIVPDIAKAEKIGTQASEIVFLVLCSGLIAVAMKITGVLLISALLILPAAIARIFSHSPLQMALMSALCGVICIISGLLMSLYFDFPSGPAIILSAAIGFVLALVVSRLKAYFLN